MEDLNTPQAAQSQCTATQPAAHPAAPPRVAQPQHEKIHGWLLVALILLSAGALRNIYVGASSLINMLPALDAIWLFSISSLLVIGMYELYMVFSFITFQPDSVFLGKSIFFIVVFHNVLRSFFMHTGLAHAILMFVFTLFQAIWLFYLIGSTQVAQLY